MAPADLQQVDLLVQHLEAHRHHYERALWLGEDPNDRAERFGPRQFAGHELLDLIENRAVEVAGSYVAFPVAHGANETVNAAFESRDEDPAAPMDTFIE